MGFMFRKVFKLGPVQLNLSKRGVSLSTRLGPATVSRKRVSVKVGQGLSYVKQRKRGKR